MENFDLDRFAHAQAGKYQDALRELKQGLKQSHWMWFIFPQLAELGRSETAKFYGIKNVREALLYLNHTTLGARLIEISHALLEIDGKTANQIFGSPDDLKLKSCMTLFRSLQNTNPVFDEVLKKFFNAEKDLKTLELLAKS